MDPNQVTANIRSRRDLWFETSVVLLLGVIPHLFNAIASFYLSAERSNFIYQSFYTVVRSSGIIALVVFLIFRSGEPFAVFGFKPLSKIKDILGGFGVYILARISYFVLWTTLAGALGHDSVRRLFHYDLSYFAPPTGSFMIPVLVMASLANAFAEELVCRAYLIPRFEQLFRSTVVAWLLSSLLFGSYHIYQGVAGFITTTMIGLLFGGIFCLTRRILPLAFAHAIQDFTSLLFLK